VTASPGAARGRPAMAAVGVSRVVRSLRRAHDARRFVRENHADPFRILISCLLSLRTRDETTSAAATRLFSRGRTPRALAVMPGRQVERAIYPVGFYRVKARTIRRVSDIIWRRHAGRVPASMEELLALPGVGRKTANLVLGRAFGLPAICVDTHVHRISNRLGWVETRTPAETEKALESVLRPSAWVDINELLVRHGQTVCHPLSPVCSACRIASLCAKRGVTRSR